jgi:predicted dehydrogenase
VTSIIWLRADVSTVSVTRGNDRINASLWTLSGRGKPGLTSADGFPIHIVANMQALGIGIIGFGRIGAEHAAWIASAGGRVACVVDPTEARRARAAAAGFAVTADLDEMLRREDVDAVLVATPTSMHFDHASAALAAGKHVMVEKPVTMHFDQAKKLAEAAKARDRVISVFHNRRWDLDYLTVRRAIVEDRVFGKVINVESRLGQWASCVGPAAVEYRPGWRNEGSFGGGGLFDWGSHFVDQIWQLMLPAKPVSVFAQLRGNVWSSDCDDFARVLINFDDGAVGLVEINTTTTRPLPRWHIDGTAGSADSPFSLGFDLNEWTKLTFTPPGGESRSLPPAKPGLSEADLWRSFIIACTAGCDPAVAMDSVLPTMRLLDAARQSSEQRCSINLWEKRA